MWQDKPDWSLFSHLGSAWNFGSNSGGSSYGNSEDQMIHNLAVWITAMIIGIFVIPFSILFFVIKHKFEVSVKTWVYLALAWLTLSIFLTSMASA